jgi:hypothetical protein
MKSLPEASVPSGNPGAASRSLISGGRVIGSFVVIVALLLGIFLFTRPQDQPASPPGDTQRSSGFALTDTQAIAKFKELNDLRIEAYRQRDPSLVAEVVTSDSPLRAKAYRDISQLRRDSILDMTDFRTREVKTLSNGSNQIVIREVEIQTPRFVTEDGKDVSRMHISLVVTTDWTLRRDGYSWKIFDSVVRNTHRLRST